MDDRTRTDTPASAPSVDTQKKRLKKQAKREARAMHALDQARRDLQKAERKLARTQQELQQRLIDVETCAAKLEKIRARQTFTEATAAPASEQGIVLQIIETKEVEIPASMQEFAGEMENLEQFLDAEESANLERALNVENPANLEIAALETALEESTHPLNTDESTPTETPAKPTPRRRASAPRSSKASPLPRTTTSRRPSAKRAKPKDTDKA